MDRYSRARVGRQYTKRRDAFASSQHTQQLNRSILAPPLSLSLPFPLRLPLASALPACLHRQGKSA